MFEGKDSEALVADLGRVRGFILEPEARDLPTATHDKAGTRVLDSHGRELRRVELPRRDRREEATEIEKLPPALRSDEREGLIWRLYWHEVALVASALASPPAVAALTGEFEWLARVSEELCARAGKLSARPYDVGQSEPTSDACEGLLEFFEAHGVDRRERVELATRLSDLYAPPATSHSAKDSLLELLGSIRRLRAQLVNGNLRFVASRINEWRGSLPFDTAFGFGVVGLARAIDGFDPRLGHQLSTYASWWVRSAVGRGMRNHRRAVRVPVHQADRSGRVVRELRKSWLLGMTKREALSIAAEKAEVDFERAYRDVQATEATHSSSWWCAGSGMSSEELLFEVATDPSGMIADPNALEECDRELASSIDRLKRRAMKTPTQQKNHERDIDVLIRRLGLGRQRRVALMEVGDDYGVTRERIRQVQEKLLERLRERRIGIYDEILDRALGNSDV